jgi:hypothetical protein
MPVARGTYEHRRIYNAMRRVDPASASASVRSLGLEFKTHCFTVSKEAKIC